VEDVLDAIDLLVAFPHQGYRRPELTSRPLRFKLVREYVIAYAPQKKP
jgi:plasmid stabilization system protein ParE